MSLCKEDSKVNCSLYMLKLDLKSFLCDCSELKLSTLLGPHRENMLAGVVIELERNQRLRKNVNAKQ